MGGSARVAELEWGSPGYMERVASLAHPALDFVVAADCMYIDNVSHPATHEAPLLLAWVCMGMATCRTNTVRQACSSWLPACLPTCIVCVVLALDCMLYPMIRWAGTGTHSCTPGLGVASLFMRMLTGRDDDRLFAAFLGPCKHAHTLPDCFSMSMCVDH